MTARQEWFTPQELAGMPGMPGSARGCLKWLEKNLAGSRLKVRGKGREYSRAGLPEQTQGHLQQLDLQEVLQALPALDVGKADQAGAGTRPDTPVDQAGKATDKPATANLPALRANHALALVRPGEEALSSAQRERDLARRLVLRSLRDLQNTLGCSKRAAAIALLKNARNGQLQPVMVAKLRQAADERGRQGGAGEGLPSVVTLCRWARVQAEGRSLAPLPSTLPDMSVHGWYRPLFALTDRPQKPTLKWAHEQLVAAWRPEWADAPGNPPPSYDAVVRAYNKRSRIDQLKGRHTGSALRSKMFFHKRTYEGMAPGTEVHADGWTTHFTAPDPKTGAFVTYEVWHFHDVATRYVTPMSVGLTENTDVILKGLENCIRVLGVPCIWQTDSTTSVKRSHQVMDEHAGLADRLGLTVVHPQEVGNSQANGMPENFNTWLDREARELATYQHPNRMDSGTFVRVRRITNAMVRASNKPAERAKLRAEAMKAGKGIVFDTHADALAWIASKAAKWNNHAHRELPRQRDEATGRMLHLSPQQSLDAAIAAGWKPVAMTEAELAEEFRPHLRKKVTRGTVTPFGGMRYHHADLAHHEGDDVLVVVDRTNPTHVQVKDLQGVLIAQAKFVVAVGPRTESMQEHTERKRAEAQIRLREKQIEKIEDRLAPAALEMADEPLCMPDAAVFEFVPAARTSPPEPSHDERVAEVLRLSDHAPRREPEPERDWLEQMGELMAKLEALDAQKKADQAALDAAAKAQENDTAANGTDGKETAADS